jgi:hypothetical protein
MPSTVFQGISASLRQGAFSSLNVVSTSPTFSSTLVASAAPPAQGVLASIALGLTGGKELTQLTAGMIFTNILGMLRMNNSKTHAVIKFIGPGLILVGGICQFSQRMTFVSAMVRAVVNSLTDRVTASVVVPADCTLNRNVLAWLASQSLRKNARALTLTTRHDDECDFEDSVKAEQAEPLTFIPSFGETAFTYAGHRMTLVRSERSGTMQDGKYVQLAAGETDPTESRNFTLTCFPTLRGTAPIQEFLNHVRHFSRPANIPAMTSIKRPVLRSSNVHPGVTGHPACPDAIT